MCIGTPGQIIEVVDESLQMAKVDISGVKRNINIALLAQDHVGPGDWVLIHVGFAMSKIDEQEAQETLQLLQTMGALYEDEMQKLRESHIE